MLNGAGRGAVEARKCKASAQAGFKFPRATHSGRACALGFYKIRADGTQTVTAFKARCIH